MIKSAKGKLLTSLAITVAIELALFLLIGLTSNVACVAMEGVYCPTSWDYGLVTVYYSIIPLYLIILGVIYLIYRFKKTQG